MQGRSLNLGLAESEFLDLVFATSDKKGSFSPNLCLFTLPHPGPGLTTLQRDKWESDVGPIDEDS